MSGKAIFGTDYTVSGTFGQITVPGGASSATVTLTALTNNLMKKKGDSNYDVTAGRRLQTDEEQEGQSYNR